MDKPWSYGFLFLYIWPEVLAGNFVGIRDARPGRAVTRAAFNASRQVVALTGKRHEAFRLI